MAWPSTGAFRGSETSLGQRPAINPLAGPGRGIAAERGPASSTTLSGDIGTVGDNSDNTYHVVTSTELASSAVLDGVVITGAMPMTG